MPRIYNGATRVYNYEGDITKLMVNAKFNKRKPKICDTFFALQEISTGKKRKKRVSNGEFKLQETMYMRIVQDSFPLCHVGLAEEEEVLGLLHWRAEVELERGEGLVR